MFNRKYFDVLKYASEKHMGVMRKDTNIPYISHPLAVSVIVIEYGGNEDEGLSSLLHDVPEDCGGYPEVIKIRELFGSNIASIVEDCSDTFESPKPKWRLRKEVYINHLSEVSKSAILVSMADKVHNVRSIIRDHKEVGDDVFKRFTGKKSGTKWYYRSLVNAYKKREDANKSLLNELDVLVSELELL